MAPINRFIQLITIALLALVPVNADPIIGAWGGLDSREGHDVQVVVIFTAAHQVAVWFDPSSGEVIHTNGGLWSREGIHVTEVVEFDSDNPGRVGSSVSFDIEFTGTELSIVGSKMKLSRIDNNDSDKLQGAWKLIDDGENDENEIATVRLMSTTRFQQITYEHETGQLISTVGGSYTLDDGRLVETVEFQSPGNDKVGDQLEYAVELELSGWRQASDGLAQAWRER